MTFGCRHKRRAMSNTDLRMATTLGRWWRRIDSCCLKTQVLSRAYQKKIEGCSDDGLTVCVQKHEFLFHAYKAMTFGCKRKRRAMSNTDLRMATTLGRWRRRIVSFCSKTQVVFHAYQKKTEGCSDDGLTVFVQKHAFVSMLIRQWLLVVSTSDEQWATRTCEWLRRLGGGDDGLTVVAQKHKFCSMFIRKRLRVVATTDWLFLFKNTLLFPCL